MTDPERAVLVTLMRRGTCSMPELMRRTRLGSATLHHTVAKLVRMGRIAGTDAGYRLTGAGRTAAKAAG